MVISEETSHRKMITLYLKRDEEHDYTIADSSQMSCDKAVPISPKGSSGLGNRFGEAQANSDSQIITCTGPSDVFVNKKQ